MIWVYVFAVILLASLLKGITGFGFALLSMPLLLFVYPVKFLIPVLTGFNLFTSILIVLSKKQKKQGLKALILPSWGILGLIPGVLFLHFQSDRTLKIFAGIMLSLLAFAFLFGYRFKIRNPRRATMIAGLVSGFLNGSISVGGPPLAFFLTSIKEDNEGFRMKFAWFSIATASSALIGYYTAGLINNETFRMLLYMFPVLITGTLVGKKVSRYIPVELFRKICILISLISGIMVLIDMLFLRPR